MNERSRPEAQVILVCVVVRRQTKHVRMFSRQYVLLGNPIRHNPHETDQLMRRGGVTRRKSESLGDQKTTATHTTVTEFC